MPTWADVVASAQRFPGVEETTSYGRPSVKVGKKLLAAVNQRDGAVALKVTDLQEKEALLEGDPEVFFTTPHYDGYAMVLVRIERIAPGLLDELVEDAWRTHALKKHLAAHEA